MIRIIALIFTLACASIAYAQTLSPSWDALLKTFDSAAASLESTPDKARAGLLDCARGFESLATNESNGQSLRASAWYNAGVCESLAGRPAQAIVSFKRAEQFDPLIAGLGEHLAAARAKAAGLPAPAATPQAPITSNAHGALSLGTKFLARVSSTYVLAAFVLAGACSTVFWTLAWWLPRSRPFARVALPTALLATALLGAWVYVRTSFELHDHSAVVIAEVSSRSGPDELSFPIAPLGVLKPGAEVAILEQRLGGDDQPWVKVCLQTDQQLSLSPANGSDEILVVQSAWIPRSKLELISSTLPNLPPKLAATDLPPPTPAPSLPTSPPAAPQTPPHGSTRS